MAGIAKKEEDNNTGIESKVPVIEVKSEGKSLVMCLPSFHKNGSRYEIIGTDNLAVLDLEQTEILENTLNQIYKKYGGTVNNTNNCLTPIDNLFKDDYASIEGNRHSDLLRVAESLVIRNKNTLSDEQIKEVVYEWNKKHCRPPLEDKEVEKQWACATKFAENKPKAAFSSTADPSFEGAKEKSLIKQAVENIMSNHHFLTIEESGQILVYSDGVYVEGGDTLIDKLSEDILGYNLKLHMLAEIKGHIRRRTYKSKNELDSDIHIINLQNGLYDICKDELKPHTPDYYSINQKSFPYDAQAKPKLFGKFLREVLYPKEIRTAVEIMAYTFYRDYPF